MWEAGISDEEDKTAELKTQPQKIKIFGTPVITEDRVLEREEKINLPPRRMKEPSEWLGMDNEIKKYVKSCPICQLQKTTRIKNQAKSILPDIPLAPNEKLVLP